MALNDTQTEPTPDQDQEDAQIVDAAANGREFDATRLLRALSRAVAKLSVISHTNVLERFDIPAPTGNLTRLRQKGQSLPPRNHDRTVAIRIRSLRSLRTLRSGVSRMAFALSDIRTDLDAALATAVDSSTWTTAIKDEAARQALKEYDLQVIYETSFTVTSAGEQQDLSGITSLRDVKALAWPWNSDNSENFIRRSIAWRYVTDQTIFIDDGEPQVGDLIRVRYTKTHTLNGLDSAVSTTVPDRHRYLLGLLAAAHACTLRIRQLSENPAIPGEAVKTLSDLSLRYRDMADQRLRQVQTPHLIRWPELGL